MWQVSFSIEIWNRLCSFDVQEWRELKELWTGRVMRRTSRFRSSSPLSASWPSPHSWRILRLWHRRRVEPRGYIGSPKFSMPTVDEVIIVYEALTGFFYVPNEESYSIQLLVLSILSMISFLAAFTTCVLRLAGGEFLFKFPEAQPGVKRQYYLKPNPTLTWSFCSMLFIIGRSIRKTLPSSDWQIFISLVVATNTSHWNLRV